MKIEGAGFYHKPSNRIFGPLPTHADFYFCEKMQGAFGTATMDDTCERIHAMIKEGSIIEGFVTSENTFLNRTEALKAINLDPKDGCPAAGPDRDWMDAADLDYVDGVIVSTPCP